AMAGSDYLPVSGTLTFAPGETALPVAVSILGDLLNEATETFALNLSNPTNAAFGDAQAIGTIIDNDAQPSLSIAGASATEGNAGLATAQATGTIVDDDGQPSLAINDVAVVEGDSGTVPATFTITLSAPAGVPVTVSYTTADGTATAGSDYLPASGALTFAP